MNPVPETAEITSTDRGRSAEPIGPKAIVREPEVSAPEPARNFSLRITGADHERVDIRLMDRGGDIRVAVRTPDADLTRNLRSGVSELAGRLEQSGYHTEIWRPAEAGFSPADHGREGGDKSGAFGARGGNPQRPQDQNQEREQRQQPRWVEEMAKHLGRESIFPR